MEIIKDPYHMQQISSSLKGSLGFVPTMGALHTGHAELVNRARSQNDLVAVSIFVNPTQFNDKEDLEKYPRTWEADLGLLESLGVDYVFSPSYESLYPDRYAYSITEKELSPLFCGADRPGHFDGVLTVVMKLLQIVKPKRAYFGEKDFQQLKLIEGLSKAFFLQCEIVPVAIVREESGLALSSRNKHLSPEELAKASLLYKNLRNSPSPSEAERRLRELGFEVDYVQDYQQRRLAAVRIGKVRLIDNVEI